MFSGEGIMDTIYINCVYVAVRRQYGIYMYITYFAIHRHKYINSQSLAQ
jgi:hypothetical protein